MCHDVFLRGKYINFYQNFVFCSNVRGDFLIYYESIMVQRRSEKIEQRYKSEVILTKRHSMARALMIPHCIDSPDVWSPPLYTQSDKELSLARTGLLSIFEAPHVYIARPTGKFY